MKLVVCKECDRLFFAQSENTQVCIDCLLLSELKQKKKVLDKERVNFNIKFQNWSNKHFFENEGSPLGKCGCGFICDYCEDNSYGNPCARALAKCAKDQGVDFDYTREDYETIFYCGAIPDEEGKE